TQPPTPVLSPLSLPDALPISSGIVLATSRALAQVGAFPCPAPGATCESTRTRSGSVPTTTACPQRCGRSPHPSRGRDRTRRSHRSEEHTSELQSPDHLVCRLL